MKIVLIGTVEFSKKAFEKLLEMDSDIIGVCTKKDSKFNSDYSDLTPLSLETINETEFATSTKDDSFIPNVFM
jgi:methionyl-tRNA formyltransferase